MRVVLLAVLFPLSAIVASPVGYEALSPDIEGSYAVFIQCRDAKPNDACRKITGPAQMAILNTRTEKGVIVSLHHSDLGHSLFRFRASRFDKAGTLMNGAALGTSPKLGEFQSEIEKISGAVRLWIRSPEFTEDLLVTGRREISPGPLFKSGSNCGDLAPHEAQGAFHGDSNGQRGVLNVRLGTSGSPEDYSAAFRFDSSGANILFDTGEFLSAEGVLSLASGAFTPNDASLKWVLRCQSKTGRRENWEGVGISAFTGVGYPISFERVTRP